MRIENVGIILSNMPIPLIEKDSFPYMIYNIKEQTNTSFLYGVGITCSLIIAYYYDKNLDVIPKG